MPDTDVDRSLSHLESLAHGLVYSSESDRPLEPVRFGPAPEGVPGAEVMRRLLALPPDCPITIVSLERALGRHTVLTDPLDLEAQAVRPRYEAIIRFFEAELTDSVAVRTGRAPTVDVWIVGRGGDGDLIGYHTVAVET